MSRLSRIICAMVLCGVVFAGCGNRELRKQVSLFMAHKITLPSELLEVKCGSISPVTIAVDKPMLIFFYGNEECSSCAVSHLKDDLSGFVDIEQSGKCKVVILLNSSSRYMLICMEIFTESIRTFHRTGDLLILGFLMAWRTGWPFYTHNSVGISVTYMIMAMHYIKNVVTKKAT